MCGPRSPDAVFAFHPRPEFRVSKFRFGLLVAGFRVSGFGLLGSPVVRVLVPGLGPRPGAKSDNRNYQVPADEADKQITDNTTLISGGGHLPRGCRSCLTDSVYQVDLQKSSPRKSRQLILYYYYCKELVVESAWKLTYAK